MWFGHGMGWGGMLFGSILMLLFWGGFLVLIFWAVKSLVGSASQPRENAAGQQFSAREILDQRYARGDITREEFEQIKADLLK